MQSERDTSSKAQKGQALKAWVRALDAIKILQDEPGATLPGMLDTLADRYGDLPALLGDGEALTYADLAAYVNRTARWAVSEGLGAGHVVCLLMSNCPEYVAIWLGLTRAGCVVALINTNLVGEALLHSIRTAASTHIIVGSSLSTGLSSVAGQLAPATRIWWHGTAPLAWAGYAGDSITDTECAPPTPQDRALLIYTSGTTGAPKAANVTHGRVLEWSLWFAGMMDARSSDRMYNCLPLYHSVGGIVAVGALLVRGGSVLIRPRFSTSRFWDDVVDGQCTIFQYIGELCRYLNASPPHARERAHTLRLACGNGLQGDVWAVFQSRFAIPHILEFYAATEGSVSLYNCEEKPGAIGRVPSFLAHRFPVAIIHCDPESGLPIRTPDGLCVACAADEIGEAIGQILADATTPARQFDGYTDAAASEKKVLRDVFVSGDRWFRTGDLMRKDKAGYFYFIDRMGDTFRWKGENVATTEVAAVLRASPGVTDAVVYGVAIVGQEGRAGMAAITTDEQFSLSALHAHLQAQLPGYAQPLFVRCCSTLDMTGTFKLTKGKLAEEGYTKSSDPVWFNDREAGRFVACDDTIITAIGLGTKRL